MECKFLDHGLAISYDQVARPCCYWKSDSEWKQVHHISKIDLTNWHQHPDLVDKHNQLKANQWPENCKECRRDEEAGRVDSGRGNSNIAYGHYQSDEITLEIRPGSVCNFACQTCWPVASSRVAQYHSQAGLIDIKNLNSQSIDNFDFLLPIAGRIKNVVLLGGEPFYDKSCRKFLTWAKEHLQSELIMFTNGSDVDFKFLQSYQGKITLVFSLDAVGKPAEYVRYGTVWQDVWNNYQRAKKIVNVRVNITCSVYNYSYIADLINLLADDWPEVVSFGTPFEEHFSVGVIPVELRSDVINSLLTAVDRVAQANIEPNQKSNAVNALNSIIANLKTQDWNQQSHRQWCDFVTAMDRVKQLSITDYCPELAKILEYVD